jgi:hypothetical protein
MKQQNNTMRQQMNQVTPKAGTLKQKNSPSIQNVSRKLIASVLMLAMIAATPASLMAGMRANDSCCGKTKTTSINFPKAVVLELPSEEMVKKADSEMTSNLYRSLKESKVAKFAEAFKAADTFVNAMFASETTVKGFSPASADETMHSFFAAENIRFNGAVLADADMNDIFTAEVAGIKLPLNVVNADDMLNARFQAENISLPGTESISKADLEINNNMMNDNAEKLAVHISK